MSSPVMPEITREIVTANLKAPGRGLLAPINKLSLARYLMTRAKLSHSEVCFFFRFGMYILIKTELEEF